MSGHLTGGGLGGLGSVLVRRQAMDLGLTPLPAEDADRALRTLERLFRHDIPKWALTGGLATEVHWTRLTGQTSLRPLNDIDFIVDSFDALPQSLANDFMFRHIHPFDPPGKTLLQMVDVDDPQYKARDRCEAAQQRD